MPQAIRSSIRSGLARTRDAPRVAIVAAHPDDEVVGASALLIRSPDTLVVHVTDGAPRDPRDAGAAGFRTRAAYATARRTEALAALGLAGIPRTRVRELGVVDQEASSLLAR